MSTKTIKRIGVLTGGGDCPGLNAVIRAVTKTAITRYGLEVYGIRDGVLGLIQNRIEPLDIDRVSGILTQGGTILGTSNNANPHRFPVHRDGTMREEDVTDRMLDHVRVNRLDALITIGGDGTQSMAFELIKDGVNCIGVPKTIDNDVMHCDRTFGFDTAVATATECLDKIHTTAMSHHRVMLVEVMGRNAGWLALHAGVAGGSDIILIPEIPYAIETIGAEIATRGRHGRTYTILCVSEGAAPAGGTQYVQRHVESAPDPIRLGGIAEALAREIEAAFHVDTRATTLGHIQRGGTPTSTDRVLATRYGCEAVNLLMRGAEGKVVVWRDGTITHVDTAEVANRQRRVPADHPLIASARAVGTSFGDPPPAAKETPSCR